MHHHALQLRGDRYEHFFRREQGDEPRLRASGTASGEHGRAVVAKAAGHDAHMAKSTLVATGRPGRRESDKILRLAKLQLAGRGTGHQPDLWRDRQPTDVIRSCAVQQTGFWGTECQRFLGTDGRPLNFAGGCINPGRHVHRKHPQPIGVELRDDLHPVGVEHPIEADAEKAVNDKRRPGFECSGEVGKRLDRVGNTEQADIALLQVVSHGADVVSVVALAGE